LIVGFVMAGRQVGRSGRPESIEASGRREQQAKAAQQATLYKN
jgi:hypothetical protein